MVILELLAIVVLSVLYVLWRPLATHSTPSPLPPTISKSTHSPAHPGTKGFVWGTDDRNYRDCPDDGALTALLFGPLASASLLLTTLRQLSNSNITNALPAGWLVEQPLVLPAPPSSSLITADLTAAPHAALEALAKSRRSLLSLSTVISLVLLLHLLLSRTREKQHISMAVAGISADSPPVRRTGRTGEKPIETKTLHWVPKSEWRRTGSVVGLAFGVSLFLGVLQGFMGHFGVLLWNRSFPSWFGHPPLGACSYINAYVLAGVSVVDIFLSSLFHQFSMYVCVRLARKGFTLGELGIVAQFSTALFMETINLTRARVSQAPFLFSFPLVQPKWMASFNFYPDLPSIPHHGLCSNVSTADASLDFSTRPPPRLVPRRLSALPFARSVPVHLPTARSPTALPRAKGTPT